MSADMQRTVIWFVHRLWGINKKIKKIFKKGLTTSYSYDIIN